MSKVCIDSVIKGILAIGSKVPGHIENIIHDMEVRGRAYQYQAEHSTNGDGEDISNEEAILDVMEHGCDGYPLHDIARVLGKTPQSLARAAGALVNSGKLERENGRYFLPKAVAQ